MAKEKTAMSFAGAPIALNTLKSDGGQKRNQLFCRLVPKFNRIEAQKGKQIIIPK